MNLCPAITRDTADVSVSGGVALKHACMVLLFKALGYYGKSGKDSSGSSICSCFVFFKSKIRPLKHCILVINSCHHTSYISTRYRISIASSAHITIVSQALWSPSIGAFYAFDTHRFPLDDGGECMQCA